MQIRTQEEQRGKPRTIRAFLARSICLRMAGKSLSFDMRWRAAHHYSGKPVRPRQYQIGQSSTLRQHECNDRCSPTRTLLAGHRHLDFWLVRPDRRNQNFRRSASSIVHHTCILPLYYSQSIVADPTMPKAGKKKKKADEPDFKVSCSAVEKSLLLTHRKQSSSSARGRSSRAMQRTPRSKRAVSLHGSRRFDTAETADQPSLFLDKKPSIGLWQRDPRTSRGRL